jgi:hypothetical protein
VIPFEKSALMIINQPKKKEGEVRLIEEGSGIARK